MSPHNTCTLQITRALLSRLHILFHSALVASVFYYRFSNFSSGPAWALMTFAELTLAFIWALTQAFRWRPVVRAVFGPEEIDPAQLPGLDVFICTADPRKEPVMEVMNSVVSALALDYPAEKLAVYLSDDGGSPLTREVIREAAVFGKYWVGFCGKYNVKTRCPEAYFSSFCDGERVDHNQDYLNDELSVKSKFEAFKKYVQKASEDATKCIVVNDRPSCVEIIHDSKQNGEGEVKMPLLVYVAREKRPGFNHHAKAGAINTLLRVSGLLSNSPFFLVLDCDMYCNDPTSARQAMCFHLDPKLAPSLAFVQYPQIFYNTSKNDIYDGQARAAFKTKYQGMDGLRGPVMSGTGYFLKRKALYGKPHDQDELLREQPTKAFGSSKIFIASLGENTCVALKGLSKDELLQETQKLAACTYESNTLWGSEVGYSYDCLLESTYCGYLLHCKGWISVYLYPKKPCFLGCATVDMNDAMLQIMKWTSGLIGVGISKFSPFTYAMSRISIMQSLCYAYFAFSGLFAVFFLIYGVVLPYSLLQGVPLFPKAGDPWLLAFAGVFISSLLQHLYEVLSSGETVKAWWNEQRIWIIKSITACLFGLLDAMLNKIGVLKASFRLTNKAVDKQKLDKYEKGRFDFQGAQMFMVPLMILVVFNLVSFFGGLRRTVIHKNYEDMFAQLFLSLFILALSYPIMEEIVRKARKGRS
ncbi:hypothetical protein RND81_12G127200 [Saponaria officinalis]|uniref:Quillaic acid 3-O-glycosyltransferase CSL1 n=1 Tax=Saponaria officinalis TaxID=3572 RepID=CSL1_SAPOF